MTPQQRAYRAIEDALFDADAGPNTFNPYADLNLECDRPDAVKRRRENVRQYFEKCRFRPGLFLLAEAPGPWGCRFSGVPITSEAQLVDPTFPLEGTPSSFGNDPKTEYSANIFWRLLAPHFPEFVVWNAFPMHPHKPGQPFTIRPPKQAELRRFAPLVARLIELLEPRTVLAVGRKAERTLSDLAIPCTYVRHPSQGGANLFRAGVRKALGLPEAA